MGDLDSGAEERFHCLDAGGISHTRAHAIVLLRVALGVFFMWFGALKVFGVSPVESLVAQTVHWLALKTFLLVLVLRPDVTFQGANPRLHTTEGEFVVNNLVLLAAGTRWAPRCYAGRERRQDRGGWRRRLEEPGLLSPT